FCLSQINTTVGDIKGNYEKILNKIKKAEEEKTDIIIFPELTICGYPPEDLVLKKGFINDKLKTVRRIAGNTGDIIAIVGFINRRNEKIYNSAAILYKGKIRGFYNKMNLPNYGVFDEKKYFA
ncbi:MAG: NAD+ synthase, partial [bacterium]|nr:NAD+ synthase [bacterium]